jgi:hypothetical protein
LQKQLSQSLLPKEISVRISGLDQPIRVRQKSVPQLQPLYSIRVRCKIESRKYQDIRRLGGRPASASSIDDLNQMRTIKLPRIVAGSVSAEFFVLIGHGGKVEARFISGAESLKKAQKALESVSYNLKFPDANPALVLRRGVLGCYQYTGCSFVLMPTEAVFSIQ